MKNLMETKSILLKACKAGKIRDLQIPTPDVFTDIEFVVKGKKIIMNFFAPKGTNPNTGRLSEVAELVNDRAVRTVDYVTTKRDTLVPILTTRYGEDGIWSREFREFDRTEPGVVKIARDKFDSNAGRRTGVVEKQYILNGQVVPGRTPIFFGFGSL